MTKVLLGFQFGISSLIHLLCCGLPLLVGVGGSLSIFIAFQPFKPVLFGVQLIFFGLTFYQLYKSLKKPSKSITQQRIAFWIVSSISFALFIYPPAHWFKSEETRLKQAQMERFFNINSNNNHE